MMADITICVNNACHMNQNCYRYLANPDPRCQSYAKFIPEGEFGCSHYWKLEVGMDINLDPTVNKRYEDID